MSKFAPPSPPFLFTIHPVKPSNLFLLRRADGVLVCPWKVFILCSCSNTQRQQIINGNNNAMQCVSWSGERETRRGIKKRPNHRLVIASFMYCENNVISNISGQLAPRLIPLKCQLHYMVISNL